MGAGQNDESIWDDVKPIIVNIIMNMSSYEELMAKMAEPAEFVKEWFKLCKPLLIKCALMKMQEEIKENIPEPLEWEEVHPALASILDNIDEDKIKDIVASPIAWFKEVFDSCKDLIVKLSIHELKPKLEPILEEKDCGLSWDDVAPMLFVFLMNLGSVEKIKEVGANPAEFCNTFFEECLPLLIKMSLHQIVRPKVSKILEEHDVAWEDVIDPIAGAIFKVVGSAGEVKAKMEEAGGNVHGFFSDMVAENKDLLVQIGMKKMTPVLEAIKAKGFYQYEAEPILVYYLHSLSGLAALKDAISHAKSDATALVDGAVAPLKPFVFGLETKKVIADGKSKLEPELQDPMTWEQMEEQMFFELMNEANAFDDQDEPEKDACGCEMLEPKKMIQERVVIDYANGEKCAFSAQSKLSAILNTIRDMQDLQ